MPGRRGGVSPSHSPSPLRTHPVWWLREAHGRPGAASSQFSPVRNQQGEATPGPGGAAPPSTSGSPAWRCSCPQHFRAPAWRCSSPQHFRGPGLEVQLPPALPGLSEQLPLRVSSAGRPGSQPTGRGSVTSQSPAPARLSLDLWFPRRG